MLSEAVFRQQPQVVGEQRPIGLPCFGSGEERPLPLVHEPQQAHGCFVNKAHEVGPNVERFGERTEIGRPHAHAKRMQGDGPQLSRIPAVASDLQSASQSRSLAITRELNHDLLGPRHSGALCVLVLLMDAGLIPVTEPCVQLLMASERRDINAQFVCDQADACASFNCLPQSSLNGTVIVIPELPSLPLGKYRRCRTTGPEPSRSASTKLPLVAYGGRPSDQTSIAASAPAPVSLLVALAVHLEQQFARWPALSEDTDRGPQVNDRLILRGTVDSDPDEDHRVPMVIIDGREVSWDELGRRVAAFEGWQFKLEFRDRSEEI